MSKLGNAIKMVNLLSEGRKYQIKELASILEVSERQIREYKNAILEAGLLIETIHGRYGGYIIRKNYTIPKTFDQKASILKTEEAQKYNLISYAIENKKQIEITYKKQEEMKKRIITPLDIYFDQEWLVKCMYTKDEIRYLKFSRMDEIKIQY